MQEIDLIAATIWGPEVGAEIAASRDAHEDARRVIGQISSTGRATTAAVDRIGAEIARGAAATAAVARELQEANEIQAAAFEQLLEMTYLLNRTLNEILAVLKSPRATESNELIERAQFAFQSGLDSQGEKWFSDATRDFTEALKIDPYNPVARWFLGRIALEGLQDPEAALVEFDECARLALPVDGSLASVALTWTSRIHLSAGRVPESVEQARQAIGVDKSSPAAFQYALSLAHGGGDQSTIREMVSWCVSDSFYAIAADRMLLEDQRIASFLDHFADRVVGNSRAIQRDLQSLVSDVDMIDRRWINAHSVDRIDGFSAPEMVKDAQAALHDLDQDLEAPDITKLIDLNANTVSIINSASKVFGRHLDFLVWWIKGHELLPWVDERHRAKGYSSMSKGWRRARNQVIDTAAAWKKAHPVPYERPVVGQDFSW